MIIDHVMKVANGKELDTGMMTKDGEFVYKHEEEPVLLKDQMVEQESVVSFD